MKIILPFLCIFGCAIATAQTDWMQKINPDLMVGVANGGVEECLIILKDQGDVSAAQAIYGKAAKGQYVYETLNAHSNRTQKEVRAVLDQKGQAYKAFWVVNAIWTVANLQTLSEIAALESVDHIEANPVWKMKLAPQDDTQTSTSTVSERNTPISWGLTKIKADSVWMMGHTGVGAIVGGQDTGYEWNHPAIKPKYRGWNGSTVDHNYNWHDAIHALIGSGANSCGLNLMAPCDDNSHGTHTAGTMVGGVNTDSIIGVAPGAKWIGCRNMEEGDGTPATYIECFEWFIMPTNLANGLPNAAMAPHVINNSWGCPTTEGCNSGNFDTMDSVVTNVRNAGIVVVVSAGNSGSACSTVNAPAAIYQDSYSVGATQSTDVIATFSSRGPVNVFGSRMKPNISAPGVAILSCIGADNNATGYGYASYQGTSMAGPHVAGMVALMISARPALAGNVSLIETIINTTAVKLFASSPFCGSDNATSTPNNVYGNGRINAKAAVDMALTVVLPVEMSAFNVQKLGKTAQLTWRTESESGCDRYEIERSVDNRTWQVIGSVPCVGQAHDYQFIDEQPTSRVNYYRIRQIDLGGYATTSLIRSVTFANLGVSLTVAALRGDGTLSFDIVGMAPEAPRYIDVYSADGRLIGHYPVGQDGQLVLPELPRGIYVATLTDETGGLVDSARFVW
jgi:serine protease AprX